MNAQTRDRALVHVEVCTYQRFPRLLIAILVDKISMAMAGISASLRHHHPDKLLVIYHAITSDVCLPDHLIHLLIGELFS